MIRLLSALPVLCSPMLVRSFFHSSFGTLSRRISASALPSKLGLKVVSPAKCPKPANPRGLSSIPNDHDFFQRNSEVVITYITDIEGDMAYLDRYVNTSKVLTFRETASPTPNFPYSHYIDFSDPQAMLVFGGDMWDKGGFDLYVIRQMLDLKRRYPDRVVLILGNRDVNKLRILQELGLQEPPPPHPGLLWFKGTGKVGDPESNLPSANSVERLKWMLAKTMGSPNAFEYRKKELQWEKPESDISDQDVVDSYRSACHPKGELGQFLSQGRFICQLGPLLFVHGSLPLTQDTVVQNDEAGTSVWDDLTFCMPWLPEGETAQDHGVRSIDTWMDALNDFCATGIQQWNEDVERIEALGGTDDSATPIWAYRGGYDFGPSYSALVQYGMGRVPHRPSNPTVVYNSFTPQGMPHRFYPDSEEPHLKQATKEFFDRTGVQLIVAGHKPQGDMPSPIRVGDESWVLLADTSYSGDTIWFQHSEEDFEESDIRVNLGYGNAQSFRGDVAVSEVLLKLQDGALRSVHYHGVLSDGTEYETANLLDQAASSSIGQVAPEHLVPSELDSPHQGRWWTKSIFSDGSHLCHAGEGFNVWNFVTKPPSSQK